MKSKLLLSLLLFLATSLAAGSQSIYRLKYRSPDIKDTVTYDAFFVLYENGAGIVRVSFKAGNKMVVAEMQIQEQYAMDKEGMSDTSKLVYEGMNPKIITGDSKIKFTPVSFWFKMGAGNNYEPWGVSTSPRVPVPVGGNFISADFIKATALTKDLVLNFFTEKDGFYINLFGPRSRGGMLSAEEKKMKMFLMVVASTYDSAIGVSVLIDARKVVQTFTDVADFLGIGKNLVIDTIYGDKYNRKNIDSIIKKRNPSPADIFVFYYSGHGFSQKEEPKKNFPFLDLRDPRIRPRPKPATQAMNIEDIYSIINKKGARFNLVISDCCNNEVIAKKTAGPPPPKAKGSGVKWNWENAKNLFLNKGRISYLITAAAKGEEASGTDSFGGFFTHFLLTSMTSFLTPNRGTASWTDVLREAQVQTTLKAGTFKTQQHPKLLLPFVD